MSACDSWVDALARFEGHLMTSHRADATVAAYMLHVKWFSEAVPDSPWSIEAREVTAWLDSHGWSLHTRRKTLVSLRAFYVWAITEGHVQRSPLVGVAAATSKPSGPPRTLPTSQWSLPTHDFLNTLHASGRARGTIRQREVWLVNLSHTFANPWAVTTQDLADYLSRSDWSPVYKRAGRTTMKGFYRWAVRSGHLTTSPADDLDTIRAPRSLPRPAPTSAIIESRTRSDEPTRLAIEIGLYAGLRIGEIVQLRMADIVGDSIFVRGKGGKQRLVPMHPELRETFAAERSRRDHAHNDSPWLFPSPRSDSHLTAASVGKRVSDALGDGWTAHTLRHRFATSAYQATTDLRAVQELLGHSKPETTSIYAAASDQALVRAVNAVRLL